MCYLQDAMLRKVLNFILNKYFITTVAFIVWLIFFDSNNLMMQQDLKTKSQGVQAGEKVLPR